MHRLLAKRFLVAVLSLSLIGTGLLPTISYAGIIGTRTVIDLNRKTADLARIETFIDQQAVRERLLDMGVSPGEVRERLAALTDEELHLLNENMDRLPAGGLLEVIGVIFVVLLILELTGVTDIFKKI